MGGGCVHLQVSVSLELDLLLVASCQQEFSTLGCRLPYMDPMGTMGTHNLHFLGL